MGNDAITSNRIMDTLSRRADEMKRRFKVRRLGLFGSYARDAAGWESDIDILVEFKKPTFDNYMDLKFFLEDLFQKGVDLVMADTLKQRLKPQVMREVMYAKGL